MIKLIATDMDGTLLNSKKEFPDHLFKVIEFNFRTTKSPITP